VLETKMWIALIPLDLAAATIVQCQAFTQPLGIGRPSELLRCVAFVGEWFFLSQRE
jgi:hypothetical protein